MSRPLYDSQHTNNPRQRLHHGAGAVWLFDVVDRVTAVIAEGKRPVPFRTRKLSSPAPMVLHPGGCGRVGHRRTFFRKKATPEPGWPSFVSGPIWMAFHNLIWMAFRSRSINGADSAAVRPGKSASARLPWSP